MGSVTNECKRLSIFMPLAQGIVVYWETCLFLKRRCGNWLLKFDFKLNRLWRSVPQILWLIFWTGSFELNQFNRYSRLLCFYSWCRQHRHVLASIGKHWQAEPTATGQTGRASFSVGLFKFEENSSMAIDFFYSRWTMASLWWRCKDPNSIYLKSFSH